MFFANTHVTGLNHVVSVVIQGSIFLHHFITRGRVDLYKIKHSRAGRKRILGVSDSDCSDVVIA